MQFRRGCWSRLQGHWTQDRPSFFLNLPTVNVPTDSTGRFSNEFNLTQQESDNLQIYQLQINFLEHLLLLPTSSRFLYKLIHLKLITFDIWHFFVDLFEQFIHQKIHQKMKSSNLRFEFPKNFQFERLFRSWQSTSPPFYLTTSLLPFPQGGSGRRRSLGVRHPRRRRLQKQAITTNLIAGARQKKALEGGWLRVSTSHLLTGYLTSSL